MINPLELTKKLITLPSYVDDRQNETPMTDFLTVFLTESFPGMTVERQYLQNSKRCNLILRGKGAAKLFVLGHVDTVQPKVGWQTNPLQPIVKNDKLYGLGASDMKGSLAAFLCALIQEQRSINTDGLLLLMYVDEEYDFKGIRRFLDSTYAEILPELTLSLDGELALSTGCRGLIEINFISKGKSGHAANPQNGVNAIWGTILALKEVGRDLGIFDDSDLGQTTVNIAAIQGGTLQRSGNKTVWLRDGNIIPDTAEVVFEIRPTVPEVTAEFVLQKIQTALEGRNLKLASSSVRHDIKPWPVQYDKPTLALLKKSYAHAGVAFKIADRKLQGYVDAQMVAEKIVAPTFILGTGGNNKHGADENLPLANLEAATKIYAALLREALA